LPDDQAPAARRAIALASPWLLPGVLIAALGFFGANSALLSSLFAALLLLTSAAVVWVAAADRSAERAARPVVIASAAALIWALLGHTAGAATDASAGLFWPTFFAYAAALAAFFAGTAHGGSHATVRRTLDTLIRLGLAWLLISLILYAVDPLHVFGEAKALAGRRFTATLLNANTAGCVTAMLAIISFGRSLDAERRSAEGRDDIRATVVTIGVSGALLLTGVVATVRSGSRIAVLLCVAGLVAVALPVLLDRARSTRRARFIAIASGLVAPLAVVVVGETVVQKLASFGADMNARAADAAYYLKLSLANPLFGRGLGSFRAVNLETLDASSELARWNYGAAHNLVLQAAIEAGWPFALLSCAAIVLAVGSTIRRARGGTYEPLTNALWVSITIGVIMGLVDIALNVPAVLVLTAWLGGIAFGTGVAVSADRRRRVRRRPRSA
jgi:hypothetical protein